MKKIILLTLIVGMFLLSFTTASIPNLEGAFTPGSCLDLPQTCPDCTYNNISKIIVMTTTDIITVSGEVIMTKDGTDYNYTFCNTTLVGDYVVHGYGDVGGTKDTWEYEFKITKTGTILNISESLIYSILAFGVLLLFIISFYFMMAVKYGNDVNEKGAVIKLTKTKYIKLGFILLTWVLFTWFLNILIGLSDNFVSLTMYYGLFSFIFDVMNRLALPLGIIVIVIALFEIIRDANIQKAISKFGDSK